ncbi:lipoyl(octanoyl) transferase LipB [Desulfobacula sp.]|uniref:lipoyl(octanoyl) transferase LipB n=1 Tax=Desulfobacula sp. TaxID=2593537 RepID=UPI00262EC8EE|nr:lipoyl(octanoyl) transferase LipB [Desulfobacula sp.]
MPERINRARRSAVFIDLDLLDYRKALDFQLETLHSKMNQPLLEDRIFFVEHPSVFTLGKRGGLENLGVSRNFLREKNIDLVQTDRGGNITYHGPGQAVLYPIVDLERNRLGVKEYVHGLEEIMKQTALAFNIPADRNPKNHGMWVENAKIGSVGISIKRGISIHGLAMNITPDLEPFSWIHPCGLSDISITSIEKELVKSGSSCGPDTDTLSMDQIKTAFIQHFSTVFDYSIRKKETS